MNNIQKKLDTLREKEAALKLKLEAQKATSITVLGRILEAAISADSSLITDPRLQSAFEKIGVRERKCVADLFAGSVSTPVFSSQAHGDWNVLKDGVAGGV